MNYAYSEKLEKLLNKKESSIIKKIYRYSMKYLEADFTNDIIEIFVQKTDNFILSDVLNQISNQAYHFFKDDFSILRKDGTYFYYDKWVKYPNRMYYTRMFMFSKTEEELITMLDPIRLDKLSVLL